MKVTTTKNLTCTDAIQCTQDLLNRVEDANLKLHADTRTDNVNGAVTINHVPNNHEITVEIYDANESPNADHDTTFKRPSPMPTRQTILNRI